jgi:arylsulfatase A-like enzyme
MRHRPADRGRMVNRRAISVAMASVLWVGGIAAGTEAWGHVFAPRDPRSRRPNILLLIADDQVTSTFTRALMPDVFAEMVDKGVQFTRAYDSTGLCCPSRSEILTGLWEHDTGVDANSVGLDRPTIVQALHDVGYRTSITGKYLNSWPCDPRPEFDQWVCSASGRGNYTYVDPLLNINGTWTQASGYTTDILASYTTSFIQSTPSDQPFFAMYTPTSPHLPASDPRCAGDPVDPYRPPNWDEDTIADGKPAYLQRGPLSPAEIDDVDADHQKMTNAARCLDPAMETVLASLGDREQDTLVIYLSDNGFLYGEHRRRLKDGPYEEVVKAPFVIRFPALVPESSPFVSSALVQNVDIAPTIADILGIHWGADGTSLVPLLTGQATSVRDAALLEDCEGYFNPCPSNSLDYGVSMMPSFAGVVTEDDKYVEYSTGEKELYDLTLDPYELVNHAGDPNYAHLQDELAGDLAALRAPPSPDTTIVSGPSGALDARVAQFVYFSQSQLATYECRLDVNGVVGQWTPCDGGSVIEGPLGDGSYTFGVRATDPTGATDGTPATRSFTITAAGPDASVTSGPPARGRSRDVSFAFSSITPGVTFQCSMTEYGAPPAWTPCDPTTGATYTGLADGQYLFQMEATGSGGTTDPPAQWPFAVDNRGPLMRWVQAPAPTTPFASQTIRFVPSEPVTGAITCALDGARAVDCSSGTFVADDLVESSHTLQVRASDTIGNKATSSVTWLTDVTPPVMSFLSEPPPSTNQTSWTFEVSSNEELANEIGIACALDGLNLLQNQDCSTSIDVFGLSDGPHTMTVVGMDVAGNLSAPIVSSWTVDTVAPTITVTGGPKAITQKTRATFTLTSDETATFQCALDAGTFQTCGPKVSYKNLADGEHTFSAFATDLAGNVSPTAVRTWTVDTTPPVTTIADGPSDPTTRTTATFAFRATDLTSVRFTCSLDARPPAACVSGQTYSGLALGTHSFAVFGTDAAGNVGEPDTWTWTIAPGPWR